MEKKRKTNDTRVGENMEQVDCSYTTGGSVNWSNHFESLWQAMATKTKHMHAPRPGNSTSRYIPKINEHISSPKATNNKAHSKT